MDSDSDMSVSSTKTSSWSELHISLNGIKQVTKGGSDLIEMIMMDSGITTNMFGNPNMITNRKR